MERQDIVDTFNPDSDRTRYDKEDIAKQMLRTLQSGKKVWEYPILSDSERAYDASIVHDPAYSGVPRAQVLFPSI